MTEKGTSILSKLTAEVMADKKAEVRKLTPVAGEAGADEARTALQGPFPVPVNFPWDRPHVMSEIATVRQAMEYIESGLKVIEGAFNAVPGPHYDAPVKDDGSAQKAAERKADADFNASFKAKQEEAQAATFEAGDPESDFGWKCPEHGKAQNKISGKGRQFVGCPDCNQFKR